MKMRTLSALLLWVSWSGARLGVCAIAPWGRRPQRLLARRQEESVAPTTSLKPSSLASDAEEVGGSESKKPERGRPLSDPVESAELLQIYKDLQTEYQEKAFHSDQWKVLNNKDGVEVSLLEHPSDPTCPYVRMKAVVPASVQDCWNFLLISEWDRTMPKMDPYYEGVSVHGEYLVDDDKVHITLCRKRTKRILTFGKRDMVFLSVQGRPLEDGTWVSGSVSVRTPKL